MIYPAIIEQGESGSLSVFFPDLPGLASAGDTLDAAKRNAHEALEIHVGSMVSYGEKLPQPSNLDAIEIDPDVREIARFLVKITLPRAQGPHN